jgi:hypothetical protein
MNTITFSRECTEFILPCFGWRVGGLGDSNVLVPDGNGRLKEQLGIGYIFGERFPVPGLDGTPVHISDFAGVINTKDGPRIVSTHSLHEHL